MQYGSYFIIILLLFIIFIGIYGFTNTDYEIKAYPSNTELPIDPAVDKLRYIFLFSTNFSPLAG